MSKSKQKDDDEDYEFGSRERMGALDREKKAKAEWESYVAQCKLEGRWPPSKTRDPHPWENGVVKPPVFGDEAKAKKLDPVAIKIDRLGHLLASAKLYLEFKRPIPAHVVKELIQLHSLWKGHDIPPEIVAAKQRADRSGRR